MSTRHLFLFTLALTLTACPKPLPDDPQPCKKEDQACVDEPAPEGPPPIGKNSPPR